VTNAPYEISAIGQLYRDRCESENVFDELKNQWGWGGFTTQDMHRSQITARAVALTDNWWSWYVRAANPRCRREALTSRPLLLAAVGRTTNHAGQALLHLTPMHAETGLIKSMSANVQAAVRHVRMAAEQLPASTAGARCWPTSAAKSSATTPCKRFRRRCLHRLNCRF
jgi:hypothetical protein